MMKALQKNGCVRHYSYMTWCFSRTAGHLPGSYKLDHDIKGPKFTVLKLSDSSAICPLALHGRSRDFSSSLSIRTDFLALHTDRPRSRSLSTTRFRSTNDMKNLNSTPAFARATKGSASTRSEAASNNNSNGRLGHVMQLYEDFVGLTEVKLAQDKVVKAEQQFLQVQEDRRAMQQELIAIQSDVRAISAELEKTHRTESKYIDLVKKEHEILLVEKEMSNKIRVLDKTERDFFSFLSAAVRESHEKERARAEKTKYWSIIGSVVGAIIGIAGSTWNNHRRMKELRAIVTESGENTAEYKAVISQLLENVMFGQSNHPNVVSNVKGMDGELENSETCENIETLPVSRREFQDHTEKILSVLNASSNDMRSHIKEMCEVLSIEKARSDSAHVVYVGPQIAEMLHESEHRLSDSMKKNTLMVTLALGGCVSIGAAIIAFFLKGPS